MRILFVHQNFPGQFKHLAPALAARGDEVIASCMREPVQMPGVRVVRAQGACGTATDGHPWSRDFDSKVIRGEATLRTAIALRGEGFAPDVIVAHPAWGEPLFLKQVWPDAKLALYCEMLYVEKGGDGDFDPEFLTPVEEATERARLWLRCMPQALLFDQAAAGISPTAFQAATFPEPMASKISVIHDGIDTSVIHPARAQPMKSGNGTIFAPGDEIVTFVNRNLEPMRGYHRFMRALPELQRRRPNAQVIIIGGDGVSYGAAPPSGASWKQLFLDEVKDRLDLRRVHFVGQVPYNVYLNILRLSRLHVYLTYPFVASWSLAEAMGVGAPILGSRTAPVTEFVAEGETGLTFDFFDADEMVDKACALLEDSGLAARLGANAAALIRERYDLKTVCLPAQLAWLDRVAAGG